MADADSLELCPECGKLYRRSLGYPLDYKMRRRDDPWCRECHEQQVRKQANANSLIYARLNEVGFGGKGKRRKSRRTDGDVDNR